MRVERRLWARAAVSAAAEEGLGGRREETGEAAARRSLREVRLPDAGDVGTEGHRYFEDGGADGGQGLERPRVMATHVGARLPFGVAALARRPPPPDTRLVSRGPFSAQLCAAATTRRAPGRGPRRGTRQGR